jgi:putative ABC transport system permease protein
MQLKEQRLSVISIKANCNKGEKMKVFKLIFKNALRHKLRFLLTVIGIAVAVLAFGTLRTVVTAWYAGAEASASDRLVVRQAVSFIFPLPYSYKEKIEQIPGVAKVTYFNWFGGVYKDKNQFFGRTATDPESFCYVYPEYKLTSDEYKAFRQERNSCIIGRDLAKQYNIKAGDNMSLEGDIYPGRWDFVVRGIYQPRDKTTDAFQMFFHWDYLNERMKTEAPGRANEAGWYVLKINDPSQAASISNQIDAMFKNSSAETKTETERAFNTNFIASSGAIITAINIMSFFIIGIIMLVLANTMIMSARERTREYAVLKTLGFTGFHITGLILGESLLISVLGGALGLFLTVPMIHGFEQAIPKGLFPVFTLENITVILAFTSALLTGVFASLFPIQRALSTNIVDGLRHAG